MIVQCVRLFEITGREPGRLIEPSGSREWANVVEPRRFSRQVSNWISVLQLHLNIDSIHLYELSHCKQTNWYYVFSDSPHKLINWMVETTLCSCMVRNRAHHTYWFNKTSNKVSINLILGVQTHRVKLFSLSQVYKLFMYHSVVNLFQLVAILKERVNIL